MSENDVTRRSFLSKIGSGIAATTIASTFVREAHAQFGVHVPDPPGKKTGWAIVGLGSLAINQILPAFYECDKSKVVALVSGHPDKAAKLAARYNVNPKNIYNYQNYDSLRDNPEVDIIYIVLPNSMHAEYTIRGLKAGKHVLCEKPMANTPADCEAMIKAAKDANRKLMIAYRCQYEPFNREMIRMAREKELGQVKAITSEHGFNIGDPTQWRLNRAMAGGGSLMDIGIYSLNAARFVTGEEPVEISAMTFSTPGDPRFKEVEETIDFHLRFPSGIIANCTSTYGYASQCRLTATTPDGWFELLPDMYYTGLRMFVHRDNKVEEVILPQKDHFASEMEHMSECVMNDKTPLTPGEEGLRDINLIMKIYEAAQTGKTVKV